MKRFVALLLIAMLCLFCVFPAMAVTFVCASESTSFARWSDDTTSVGTTWSLSWSACNLSSTRKAAVKIFHAPGVYASHTYYYQGRSTASHNYLSDYAVGQTVYVAGKKYSGTGKILVFGTFNP